jgi:hypothetical protein
MADEVEALVSTSRCNLCNDLCGKRMEGTIESLKLSAENGCTICSFVFAGIRKIEMEDGRRTRVSPRLRKRKRGSDEIEPPWTHFWAILPENQVFENNTFEVNVGYTDNKIWQSATDRLEFHIDPGVL